MLNPDVLGIFYLIIFRVSVVVAGVVSIVCGYRLFVAGVFGLPPGTPPTEISGRFSGAEFSLKSLAPGTCFALFGAIVIGAMMVSTPPEFGRSRVASILPDGEIRVAEESKMRGPALNMAELVQQAKGHEQQGNTRKAIEVYESALRLIAEPLNNLAWLYLKAGRDKEALLLSQLATQFAPNVGEFTDTLDTIHRRGRKE
jgi:tetratricopeptide (TPR) repeat protein